MIRAVIFDLDDTLISEKKYIESGFKHISKLLSNRLNKDERELYHLIKLLFDVDHKNVFNRLLDKLGIAYTQTSIKELVEEYRNHHPDISFFNDVIPCLNLLKEKNVKVGIITDGYSNAQRQKLRAIKASDFFLEIILTDELGKDYWKPHPRAFELMREKLKIEFNEMAYIGDNPAKDFYIGSIYPIRTIRVIREGIYSHMKYLKDVRENHLISNLFELNSFLGL